MLKHQQLTCVLLSDTTQQLDNPPSNAHHHMAFMMHLLQTSVRT